MGSKADGVTLLALVSKGLIQNQRLAVVKSVGSKVVEAELLGE